MKTYTLAQILSAWTAAYGEDMNVEYPAFIQRLSEEDREEKDEKTLGRSDSNGS